MGKTVEQFQAQFKGLQDRVDALNDSVNDHKDRVAHFAAMIKAGCVSMGDRLQELKDAGLPGNTLESYLKRDTELGRMNESVLALQDKLENVLGQGAKLQTDINVCLKAKKDLIADVSADVARRTAKEKGSKSLPTEVELLKKIRKFGDSRALAELEGFAPETVATHRKQLAGYIEAEWKQTKEGRIPAQALEFMRQAIDARRLKGSSLFARKTKEDIMEALALSKPLPAKIRAAKDDNARQKLMQQFFEERAKTAELKNRLVELQDLAKNLAAGLELDWIKGQLNPKYRTDGPQIRNTVLEIIENSKEAAAAFREFYDLDL
jgi:predicted  nucleic acid-binding Zn-ribbon protein